MQMESCLLSHKAAIGCMCRSSIALRKRRVTLRERRCWDKAGKPCRIHSQLPRQLRVSAMMKSARVVKELARNNFVSLMLVGGMTVGLLQPAPGRFLQQHGASKWATTSIFLLSGLSLQDEDFAKACQAWPCGLLALVSILFLTPMAASLVLRINLTPKELVTGLAIFCCAPTTISSGVTLAEIAGANKALALALTVASNCLGIVTMPLMISTVVGRGLGVEIPARELLWNMVQAVLLPLLIGKVARESISGLRSLITANREAVSRLSAILLSMVPWMQVSCSRSLLLRVQPTSLLLSVGLGIGLHLLFLVGNHVLFTYISGTRFDKASTRGALLVSSQKTLPVSMAVIESMKNQLGESGLLILPCISAHFLQIIIDSVLVNFWLQSDAATSSKQQVA